MEGENISKRYKGAIGNCKDHYHKSYTSEWIEASKKHPQHTQQKMHIKNKKHKEDIDLLQEGKMIGGDNSYVLWQEVYCHVTSSIQKIQYTSSIHQ